MLRTAAAASLLLVAGTADAGEAQLTKTDGRTETFEGVADVFERPETGQTIIRFTDGRADIVVVGGFTIVYRPAIADVPQS